MKRMTTLLLGCLALATTAVSNAAGFRLSSPDVQEMKPIGPSLYANSFGCSGENLVPRLEWNNSPVGTRSYALTLHDEDAPTGSGFWHWVVYDIPANTTGLKGGRDGGSLPAGAVQGNTDLGKPGFMGPCPPPGRKHRYRWTLHALKVDKLPIETGATAALVGFYLWQNELAKTSLTVIAGPR